MSLIFNPDTDSISTRPLNAESARPLLAHARIAIHVWIVRQLPGH